MDPVLPFHVFYHLTGKKDFSRKVLKKYLRNSKNLPANKLVFGQECELTGPMGRSFKCTPTRTGDVVTTAAAGVEIS